MIQDESIYYDTAETAPVIAKSQRSIDAATARELRDSTIGKKLKAKFREECSRQRNPDGSKGAPCWLCGGTLDYRLKAPHPSSWSLDHAKTVKERPDLVLDPMNFRAAHLDCNFGRGTDEPKIDIGEPSELW
jgi:hypothetical protein